MLDVFQRDLLCQRAISRFLLIVSAWTVWLPGGIMPDPNMAVSTRPPRPDCDSPEVAELAKRASLKQLSHLTEEVSPLIPKQVDVGSDVDDSFIFELDLSYSWESSWVITVWNLCLASTALLDFSAAIADNFDDDDDRDLPAELSGVGGLAAEDHAYKAFQDWLLSHAKLFAFLFSFMWFLDAFMTAHQRRLETLRERDRQRLLRLENERLGQATSKEPEAKVLWWKGAHGVYYTTMAVQILLLPVGFFVFSFSRLHPVNGDDVQIEIVYHSEDEDVQDDYEVFTQHASISLGFAITKHIFITIARRLGLSVRQLMPRLIRGLVKRLALSFLRNPFRFGRRVRKVLQTVRWIKYLAPLYGASNKLKENVYDLLKKHRQHREAVRARKIRAQLWNDSTEEELREYCAILIQKTFRAHQIRKKVAALKLLLGRQEDVAARKLQTAFRASLRRARNRLNLKRVELKLLQEKEKETRKEKKQMDVKERLRMHMLQKELNEEAAELLNEKLLLRPNTSFAVAWKILFVFAVIFEISQLAFKPILAKYKDREGRPMKVDALLDQHLVPIPVNQRLECKLPDHTLGLLSIVRSLFQNQRRIKSQPLPWYCESPSYSKFISMYSSIIRWSIQSFLDIVGLICFLDVFITFFTGDYDETGTLVPKPFVKRWVLPGLLLQLLVNPTMESTSDVIFRAIKGLIRRGPFRVLRWTLALFFPLGKLLTRVTRSCWLELVRTQNKQAVLNTNDATSRALFQ